MKLSKIEGCLKLAMKRASFKNHLLASQDLWWEKNKPGTASRSPQLKVLPSLRFISHLTGAPSRNDVSSQVPWIPSHGGLRRLNAEQVFGIQAICERIVKPHNTHMGLSINKQTKQTRYHHSLHGNLQHRCREPGFWPLSPYLSYKLNLLHPELEGLRRHQAMWRLCSQNWCLVWELRIASDLFSCGLPLRRNN